jgi:hypothetical protein
MIIVKKCTVTVYIYYYRVMRINAGKAIEGGQAASGQVASGQACKGLATRQ